MTTTRNRIKQILEEFTSASAVSHGLAREFRDWFSGKGHEAEKQEAFRELMESNIRFEPNPGDDVREAYKKIASRLGFEETTGSENNTRKFRMPRRNMVWRIAAVLVPVIAVLGSAFYMWRKAEPVEVLMTAKEIVRSVPEGEKEYVVLPDGSTVWMNGNSTLEYMEDFGEERLVKLSGEALFAVGKADGKPFTVVSGHLKVTVLGTVFNISARPGCETATVSLYEGRLKVDAPDIPYMLDEGHKLEYDLLAGSARVKEISGTGPSWMRDVINYSHTPATDVLNSLGKKHGYSIVADDPSLSENIITLSFEDETGFEEALLIISEMCGFNYRIHEKTVYITKR